MDREQFESIFNKEDITDTFRNLNDDNAAIGLNLIRKYLPTKGIEGADHDVIYSVEVDEIVAAGITKEDAQYLHEINWHIDEDSDSLACFV